MITKVECSRLVQHAAWKQVNRGGNCMIWIIQTAKFQLLNSVVDVDM